jgi:hypothetical protein
MRTWGREFLDLPGSALDLLEPAEPLPAEPGPDFDLTDCSEIDHSGRPGINPRATQNAPDKSG